MMKNKQDAINALSAAGWSLNEIKSVLNTAAEYLTPSQSGTNTPWWTYLNDIPFNNGIQAIEDWYNWLEQDNPCLN